LWVLCVVRRADHSSRGILPTVERRCVWSRNLVNEKALAHWGVVAPKQTPWNPQTLYAYSHLKQLQIILHNSLFKFFISLFLSAKRHVGTPVVQQ